MSHCKFGPRSDPPLLTWVVGGRLRPCRTGSLLVGSVTTTKSISLLFNIRFVCGPVPLLLAGSLLFDCGVEDTPRRVCTSGRQGTEAGTSCGLMCNEAELSSGRGPGIHMISKCSFVIIFLVQAATRSALETGTLDLEGRGLTSLAPELFEDARVRSAMTRAKLSGNKLQVCHPKERLVVPASLWIRTAC